jgi:hypothetical protein
MNKFFVSLFLVFCICGFCLSNVNATNISIKNGDGNVIDVEFLVDGKFIDGVNGRCCYGETYTMNDHDFSKYIGHKLSVRVTCGLIWFDDFSVKNWDGSDIYGKTHYLAWAWKNYRTKFTYKDHNYESGSKNVHTYKTITDN